MTPLRAALQELLAVHDALGSPLSRCVLPGRPADEVRSRLAALGLVAPEELVDWFGWGEPDRAAWEAAGAISDPTLFWAGYWITPERAIGAYQEYQQMFDLPTPSVSLGPIHNDIGEEQWDPSWFPFLWSSPAEFIIECAGALRVRRVDYIPGYPDQPPAPVIFGSILELVQAAVRAVRDHYFWDSIDLQPRDPNDPRRIEQY